MNSKLSLVALIAVLVAAMFYAYAMLIQVLPLALASSLRYELQLSGTDLGLLSSSFYWSYAPMQLVAGYLVTRFGVRRVLNNAILVCCLGGALFALANRLIYLQLARALMGCSTACAFVATLTLIMNRLPTRLYAFISGMVGTLGALGGAMGSAPVAFMLNFWHWRQVVAILVFIGLGLWLLSFWCVQDHPATLEEQIAPVCHFNNQSETNHNRNHQNLCQQIITCLATMDISSWLVVIYSLLIWSPMLAFVVLWSAPFLQLKWHLTNVLANHIVMYCWLGLAVFSPLLGWYSERMHNRSSLMIGCGLVGIVAMAAIIWLPISVNVATLAIFALGLASAGQSLSFMWVRDRFAIQHASIISGIVNFAIVLGGVIAPILVGMSLDHGLSTKFHDTARHVFSLQNYQNALIIAPICYLGATLLAGLVWYKEKQQST